MTQHRSALIVAAKVPSIQTQKNAADAWRPDGLWLPEHGSPDEFIASLSPGDLVGVWSCELLAPPIAKRNGDTRRKAFRRAADALIERGVLLEEWKTGRVSTDPATMLAMFLDAVDAISGVSGNGSQGRPSKEPFTDEEKQLIANAWFHRKHRNNPQRVAAVQKLVPRFMEHDFYKHGFSDELRKL
ncbi:MAG: hypothetical protein GY952_14030 [Rhodobacteraceae bacterium]|nr:hypothetical protein [Paracoccaceae bacterium]